jgi:hypothetical protein
VTDLDALLERVKREHVACSGKRDWGTGSHCLGCGYDWPCDPIQLVEALEAERATAFGYWTAILDLKRELEAERER